VRKMELSPNKGVPFFQVRTNRTKPPPFPVVVQGVVRPTQCGARSQARLVISSAASSDTGIDRVQNPRARSRLEISPVIMLFSCAKPIDKTPLNGLFHRESATDGNDGCRLTQFLQRTAISMNKTVFKSSQKKRKKNKLNACLLLRV
jgi:hypothetical protein